MKMTISNGIYYMAIHQRNSYYQNLTQNIAIILKIDSNLNTNSWLSYQPAAISNDLVDYNIL